MTPAERSAPAMVEAQLRSHLDRGGAGGVSPDGLRSDVASLTAGRTAGVAQADHSGACLRLPSNCSIPATQACHWSVLRLSTACSG